MPKEVKHIEALLNNYSRGGVQELNSDARVGLS